EEPEVKNQGRSGTSAPPAKVKNDERADPQGEPSSCGSKPSDRAYVASARSGTIEICLEALCAVACITPPLRMNCSISSRASSGQQRRCSRNPVRRLCKSSTWAEMETYSPTAIENAPATSEARPASS